MDKEEANRRLFQAIENGKVARARSAIEAGADVNARDGLTRTPLHLAARYNHRPIAELLITRHADVNARDDDGATPLHYAACHFDHKLETAELLIAHGADIGARDNNRKGLDDWAIQEFNYDFIELLKEAAKQQGHAGRVTEERKDKGPPQVGG